MMLLAAAGAEQTSEVLVYTALGGYVIAAPAIHFAHGNPGRAMGSLGIRVGLPLVLGGATYEASACSGEFCAVGAVFFGTLGALGAMAIDAAVFAYEPASGDARRLAPVIALNPGMTYFGARGAF